MPHKLIDINEIPKKNDPRRELLANSILKIAETVPPLKAIKIDCEKLDRKRSSVISKIRQMKNAGVLDGLELKVRGEDIFLVRPEGTTPPISQAGEGNEIT